jgi:hypothetical protein
MEIFCILGPTKKPINTLQKKKYWANETLEGEVEGVEY